MSVSITKIFGKDEKDKDFAKYYLQKFIDITISVPKTEANNKIRDLFKEVESGFDTTSDERTQLINDYENFLSSAIGSISIRTLEKIAGITKTIDTAVRATSTIKFNDNKPSLFCFCASILKTVEKYFLNDCIHLETEKKDKIVLTKFVIQSSNQAQLIETQIFKKEIEKWSESSCQLKQNRFDNHGYYYLTGKNFQDHIKKYFCSKQSTSKIESDFQIASIDSDYLSQFSDWLRRLS